MRKNQLTPVEVKNLNETGRYADGGGLYLQVTRWEKAGEEWATKAWLFRFMLNGRAREMGLGSADVFTLAEARERAKAQRKLLADRIDPLEQRKRAHTAAKLEAARAITFADAAEAYIGRIPRAGATRSTWHSGRPPLRPTPTPPLEACPSPRSTPR